MRFSERIGKRPKKVDIQVESLDDDLRNSLWNIITLFVTEPMNYDSWVSESPFKTFFDKLWFSHFVEPIDKIPGSTERLTQELRRRFYEWDYLDVYDLINFMAQQEYPPFNKEEFIESCNVVLKRELSGYRFIHDSLTPIINDQEILEVEKAISDSVDNNLIGVHIHLTDALHKLSDRKKPDFRNSIKESISAVESLCQKITGDDSAELGKALKKIGDKITIHAALQQGFIKIYGWTSDSDGIRHAMMDEPNLDQEDALYMLVSCSSFINYLIRKSQKAGIILN
jgi:hypothetical protein